MQCWLKLCVSFMQCWLELCSGFCVVLTSCVLRFVLCWLELCVEFCVALTTVLWWFVQCWLGLCVEYCAVLTTILCGADYSFVMSCAVLTTVLCGADYSCQSLVSWDRLGLGGNTGGCASQPCAIQCNFALWYNCKKICDTVQGSCIRIYCNLLQLQESMRYCGPCLH